ncbi:MAG: hypothetical protein KF729_12325 [Sandaracinaceae bacterium]|nr:hypothetical protein [Sandaracinaceae bacterium]
MSRAIAERLGFFARHAMIERLPSAWQVSVGWLAMLPITLSESERERARSRATWMSQLPRRALFQGLYEPRQLLVDTGLRLRAAQVVGHVLSVYHEDAFLGYDLQLLQSHPGGLALLRSEATKVARGETRWASYLKALTSWPGYHARLVELAEEAEAFRYPDPLDLDPRFATLVGFAAWCATLPDWPGLEHYR